MVLVGWVVVLICVLGGYAAMGGHLYVLNQPFEFVIIGGAGFGAMLVANPNSVLKQVGPAFGYCMKAKVPSKTDYLELLTMLYSIFRLAKQKGMLALEAHVEKPEESPIFQRYPSFLHNHHAVEFFCDYMRLLTMGSENAHEMDNLMEQELEVHHQEQHLVVMAITNMGDGFPALGIVAAVLGVIKTMGAISQPPEVLGKLIGGALVGTFLGILLCYGFIGPMAQLLKNLYEEEARYYQCIRAGIMAHMSGYPPAVSIEFARKSLPSDKRPTFYELEQATAEVPTA